MPHIVIKTVKGPSPEQLRKAAEQISDIMVNTLGKPARCVSVSAEEYTIPEWEGVYNDFVKDKDNVVLAPEYTNPRTFE